MTLWIRNIFRKNVLLLRTVMINAAYFLTKIFQLGTLRGKYFEELNDNLRTDCFNHLTAKVLVPHHEDQDGFEENRVENKTSAGKNDVKSEKMIQVDEVDVIFTNDMKVDIQSSGDQEMTVNFKTHYEENYSELLENVIGNNHQHEGTILATGDFNVKNNMLKKMSDSESITLDILINSDIDKIGNIFQMEIPRNFFGDTRNVDLKRKIILQYSDIFSRDTLKLIPRCGTSPRSVIDERGDLLDIVESNYPIVQKFQVQNTDNQNVELFNIDPLIIQKNIKHNSNNALCISNPNNPPDHFHRSQKNSRISTRSKWTDLQTSVINFNNGHHDSHTNAQNTVDNNRPESYSHSDRNSSHEKIISIINTNSYNTSSENLPTIARNNKNRIYSRETKEVIIRMDHSNEINIYQVRSFHSEIVNKPLKQQQPLQRLCLEHLLIQTSIHSNFKEQPLKQQQTFHKNYTKNLFCESKTHSESLSGANHLLFQKNYMKFQTNTWNKNGQNFAEQLRSMKKVKKNLHSTQKTQWKDINHMPKVVDFTERKERHTVLENLSTDCSYRYLDCNALEEQVLKLLREIELRELSIKNVKFNVKTCA